MAEVRFSRQERSDRAVCKRCGMVMDDGEPMSNTSEFHHKTKHKDSSASKCPNAGQTFYFEHQKGAWRDAKICPACGGHGYRGESSWKQTCAACGGSGAKPTSKEVELFMRKRTRRAVKRATK